MVDTHCIILWTVNNKIRFGSVLNPKVMDSVQNCVIGLDNKDVLQSGFMGDTIGLTGMSVCLLVDVSLTEIWNIPIVF